MTIHTSIEVSERVTIRMTTDGMQPPCTTVYMMPMVEAIALRDALNQTLPPGVDEPITFTANDPTEHGYEFNTPGGNA